MPDKKLVCPECGASFKDGYGFNEKVAYIVELKEEDAKPIRDEIIETLEYFNDDIDRYYCNACNQEFKKFDKEDV